MCVCECARARVCAVPSVLIWVAGRDTVAAELISFSKPTGWLAIAAPITSIGLYNLQGSVSAVTTQALATAIAIKNGDPVVTLSAFELDGVRRRFVLRCGRLCGIIYQKWRWSLVARSLVAFLWLAAAIDRRSMQPSDDTLHPRVQLL